MLKITKGAVQWLRATLADVRESDEGCLRIMATEHGPELLLDEERPGDHTLERDGEMLLVMDEDTMDQFHGRILDVDEATALLVLT